MSKVNQLRFDGQTIFCGIDVHKKSWRVNVRNDEFELEDYNDISVFTHSLPASDGWEFLLTPF